MYYCVVLYWFVDYFNDLFNKKLSFLLVLTKNKCRKHALDIFTSLSVRERYFLDYILHLLLLRFLKAPSWALFYLLSTYYPFVIFLENLVLNSNAMQMIPSSICPPSLYSSFFFPFGLFRLNQSLVLVQLSQSKYR